MEENDITDKKQLLLADAIRTKSDIEELENLVLSGCDVSKPVTKGLTPLHYAVYENYIECVQYLINRGCLVNSTDDNDYTPLHLAARYGLYDVIHVLLNNGAKVNFCDTSNVDVATTEPLNLAVANNHPKCVKLLLDNKAEVNRQYFIGYEINTCPLEHLACLELLLQYGASTECKSRCGMTPLMKACKEISMSAIRILIKYGADVNAQTPEKFDNKPVLHFAVMTGSDQIIRLLLDSGASITRPKRYANTFLELAIIYGRYDVFNTLMEYGAGVNEVNENQQTPLMITCSTPNIKYQLAVMEHLLENGAYPNHDNRTKSFASPFQCPIVEYVSHNADCNKDALDLLIKFGARIQMAPSYRLLKLGSPFGILKYVSGLEDDVLDILIEASEVFNIEAIVRDENLTESRKLNLFEIASSPLCLRHLCRCVIRYSVQILPLTKSVQTLCLPKDLKSYVLFEH